MMKQDRGNALLLSDLPESSRSYAEVVGLDNFKKLADSFGGTCIYIPTADSLNNYALKRLVREEFKAGKGIAELSKKYRLSRSTIYRYTNE